MAIFQVVENQPGTGKSLYAAQITRKLINRNFAIYKKFGIKRKVASNIKYSSAFEGLAGDFLMYWSDVRDLVGLRDVDIIWDEIANDLDSRDWENLPHSVKRFLSAYRKRGCDIYANTQDFGMVDKRARIMVNSLLEPTKILGSADPSATRPEIKRVWGVIMLRQVMNVKAVRKDPDNTPREYFPMPEFFTIKRKDIEIYDTRQDILKGEYAPFEHKLRRCSDDDCNFTKIIHR